MFGKLKRIWYFWRAHYYIKWLWHILFGKFYECCSLSSKGRFLNVDTTLGVRVRQFRWFLGRPTVIQDSLLGSFKQIAKKLPDGIWEHAELDGIFGVGWEISDRLYEFDLLRVRYREIVFTGDGEHWYRSLPLAAWQKPDPKALRARYGIFPPYSLDFWWEVS